MKLLIFIALVGTVLAVSFAEPSRRKLQSLQALLQDDDAKKLSLSQLQSNDLAKMVEALIQSGPSG